jgi:hypothetical protein
VPSCKRQNGAVVQHHHESIHGSQKGAIVRHGDDRSLEPVECSLQRLGGVDVQVVRRLVEEEQVVTLQHEDQHL